MNSEHERYLAEKVFKGPVIVYNHPKEFKAFYMLLNEDGKTVASMDVLVPGVIHYEIETYIINRLESLLEVLKENIDMTSLIRKLRIWDLINQLFGGTLN